MSTALRLDSDKIIQTVKKLEVRIGERFPDSGLREVCKDFLALSEKSKSNIDWISKSNLWLKTAGYVTIFIGLSGLAYSFSFLDLHIKNPNFAGMVTLTESIFNNLILIGAAIFFLVTLEVRIKRKKTIKRLNELRMIAHVVDMHQLTKTPSMINGDDIPTKNSPKRTLTKFELERYLDYCSEISALVAKVAALYAQSLPDEVVVRSVNEIENLCTGLSRKIWQKLVILSESD